MTYCPIDYSRFSSLRAHVKHLNQILLNAYINKLRNNIWFDPRSFWSFQNAKRSFPNISDSTTFKNIMCTDSVTSACPLRIHFHLHSLLPIQ